MTVSFGRAIEVCVPVCVCLCARAHTPMHMHASIHTNIKLASSLANIFHTTSFTDNGVNNIPGDTGERISDMKGTWGKEIDVVCNMKGQYLQWG